jgi:hypothetical protein
LYYIAVIPVADGVSLLQTDTYVPALPKPNISDKSTSIKHTSTHLLIIALIFHL